VTLLLGVTLLLLLIQLKQPLLTGQKYIAMEVKITSFSTSTYPSQNLDTMVNFCASNMPLEMMQSGGSLFDGYLADTYFVDGTALDPTSFGEFKSGVWIPKAYTGSYGTNGFHLTYQDDTVSEGFNTVTYTGNGANQKSVVLALAQTLFG
jgi:hypothetical protein